MRDHAPPSFDIRGSGRAFFVLHNGQQVGGPYTSNDNAIAALGGIERKLFPDTAKFRSCCRCRTGFMSSGVACCPDCRRAENKERRNG